MKILKCLLTSFVLLVAGCKGGSLEQVIIVHSEAVSKGIAMFPEIKNLSEKFEVISSIQNFNSKTLQKTWHSQFILHERYLVVMAVPVDYDIDKGSLKRNGGSFLMINEITSIDDPADQDAQISVSYSGGLQRRLEGDDLDRLIKSGWDFEKIGIVKKAPIKNIDIYWDRMKKLNPK